MSDKEQQLLDLFEKYKKDLDGGRLEALFKFTEECEKELKKRSLNGKLNTPIIHSYIMGAYEVGRKRASDYYKALKKDEEERRFHITCEETPPDGELVYCVGQDHCTKKELSGIYFYHNGYWWTDELRKSDECWWDGTGINDYVFYKWMKLPKEINYMEITQEDNITEGNPLTTEVQKIDWLNTRIKNLEYLLESDFCDAEDVECNLQMLRELLSIKMITCRANAVRKIKNNLSRDAAEFLKDFGGLTDAEKMSIKSLICLQTRC